MKTEFNVGDLVYNLRRDTSVYRLEANTETYRDIYPLAIVLGEGDSDTFTKDGKFFNSSELPTLFKATEENRKLLSALYGVEIEAPPAKPTPRSLIEALIERNGFCWCGTSDESYEAALERASIELRKIRRVYEDSRSPFRDNATTWKYAVPIDPATCEEITELPT